MMLAITIRRAVLTAAMLGLMVGAAGRARADFTINFDDVSIPVRQNHVPLTATPGYDGFSWTNFSVANSSYLSGRNEPSEVSGVVSSDQAAFNFHATPTAPAELTTIGGTTFNLISASLTSISATQTVEVEGFRPGSSKPNFDITYAITNLSPTFVNFALDGFTGIQSVKFITASPSQLFVMDDLKVSSSVPGLIGSPPSGVPELDSRSCASALTLLTSGVLILNGRRKR
jgi:hypothetical protein